MISTLLEQAKAGKCVSITDVERLFEDGGILVGCEVELSTGGLMQYTIRLPYVTETDEVKFVQEYFYARIYNLISALGGKAITLHIDERDLFAKSLCDSLNDTFGIRTSQSERQGYGKCLNVTDRINAALKMPPFVFKTEFTPMNPATFAPRRVNALANLRGAVQNAMNLTLCGMDIGGTDIKLVGIKNGSIVSIKEYDWLPAEMRTVDELIAPILLLARVMRVSLSMPENPPEAVRVAYAAMMNRHATDADMQKGVEFFERQYGEPIRLGGIGVCFPDVVIDDMIVGGETYKTRGIRACSPNYAEEFKRLASLKNLLAEHCMPGGPVHLSNDGSLAAYTAAVEFAHSGQADDVLHGVFAHTLGTELGSGWIDETGEIPQIPLEIYNCIIDLGSYPARGFDVLDVRSVRNFNTGIAGTLQKYTSQSGAYRLALQYFESEAIDEYKKLFELGYIEKRGDGIFVVTSPDDMRKPLLEHIMALASSGQPQAEKVFREIGAYLAIAYQETEYMLAPRTKPRVLFGRFIKHQRCFELMQEGASAVARVRFIAADDELAYTPLMLDLREDRMYTVAQFGQAVGAAYYAASAMKHKNL